MNAFNKEAILSQLTVDVVGKNSPLKIGAQLWDPGRAKAFKAAYDSMRELDDLVDNVKEANNGVVPPKLREELFTRIDHWLAALSRQEPIDDAQATLIKMMTMYKIPIWPWKSLARAMAHDVRHNGYPTYDDFLKYAEGAAVAPGAVYMHLCAVREVDNVYEAPEFDVQKAARPLALFSYLVHIVRDFQKDQCKGMNYFAADMMAEAGLSASDLVAIAQVGEATPALRSMMCQYYDLAGECRIQSRTMLNEVRWHMQPQYILCLEVLFDLYQQIFGRIDLTAGNFTGDELNSSPDEMLQCITKTVRDFTV